MSVTGPADLRDQRWLDEQVQRLGDGIEAAREIWANWTDGRNVGRLHPEFDSPGPYVESLGLRLPKNRLGEPFLNDRSVMKTKPVKR